MKHSPSQNQNMAALHQNLVGKCGSVATHLRHCLVVAEVETAAVLEPGPVAIAATVAVVVVVVAADVEQLLPAEIVEMRMDAFSAD